jgi:hypothetical protein
VHNRGSLLLALLVAALLVGGALAYGLSQGAEVATTASSAPAMPAVAPAPATPAIAPAPPRAARPAAPSASKAAPAARESLSQKVDRLSRSADPVDAFAAYQLVTACIWARDHEGWMARHILPGDRALLPTTQQACGDIASDQIQSRLRWLERAALAGVHHAATEMLKEGPDGLGIAGSSDIDAPENAAWKQRVDSALAAGVRTCDPDSLEDRVNRYQGGQGVEPDRAKALTYWVAYLECRRRAVGTPAAVLGDGDGVTQRMGHALSAEQVAQAVADGRQIARDARPLPGDD